jgi:DNA-binding CsgD family transcriptional regulator/tetratricopeptide (TPR) repeat protein
VAHLSEVDDALAAVDSLVGTALVSCELGIVSEVAFAHPLIRSAIYHALDASACAALHVRAASLSDEPAMALHHRVAASHGHDPVLADELLTVGRIEATAGDLVSAAARYEAAGQLTSDARVRERSLVEQFECFWASGDSMSAEAVLDQFEPGSRSPARTYIEGALAIGLARADGEALLFDVWEGPNSYSWLRSRAAGVLAPHLASQGRGSDVLRAASCWYEAEPDDLFPWSLPLTALQASLLQLGRVQEAIEMAADIERRPDIEIRDLDALIGRGMIREFIDDLTGARADLGFVYQATRRRSARFALVALIHLAETEYRAGAWDSSIAHGELAASLACDTEQHWCAALAHAVAAMPLAGRGAIEPAEAHVAKAHRCAAAAADPVNFLWAATAEARVAHARGEPEAVVRALEVLTRRAPGDDVEPGFQPWRALLAEALVQLGQFDEAEQALRVFEHSAVVLERRSALVTAARVRGQLEHARQRLGAADDAFDRGAAQAIGLPNEFEVGLFDLARARYLRRARRRGAATTALRTARRRFFGLGALPYVEMCDAELAAVGAGTQRRERTDAHDLTPQELAVARLVTTGLTNREVATELYLSVKTVEYHLGKVFTKLGISSRTQLAQRMNAGRTGL